MSAFASLYLLLAAGYAIQDQNPLVSAEVRAASAPIAIANLSKQINFPLEAMPSTKGDILVIRVDKVPLKTLLQKIADSTGAGWEATSTGYRLVRNDAIRQEEARKEQEQLVGLLRDSVQKMKKRAAANEPMTQQKAMSAADQLINLQEQMRTTQNPSLWRNQEQLRQQAPVFRIMQNLLANITPETLASVPRGRAIVFSTNPNRMQRRMPMDLSAYLKTFMDEQKIWARAQKAARERRGGEEFYYDENYQDPGERQIGKVLLKVSRPSGLGGQNISIRLMVADTKGRLLAGGQDTMGWSWQGTEEAMAKAAKLGADEESIKFKGQSKQIFDVFRKAYEESMKANGREPTFNLPSEVRELFINVDKYEPLSFLATDALFEIARIKKLNLVACPPDTMIFVTGFGQAEEPKPSAILTSLQGYGIDTDFKDGWLVLKPVETSSNRALRTDRVALANYIRRTIKEGRLTLDNKAAFALASGLEEEDFLPTVFMTALGLASFSGDNHADWDTLRLYATLTPTQWQLVRSRRPLPFRSLQPIQTEIIRHMLFDSAWSRLQTTYSPEDMNQDPAEEPVIYGGLEQEATEMLPNGFTGAEMLNVTETVENRLFGKPTVEGSSGIMWGEQAMTPDSLAQELFQSERPEFFPWLNQPGYNRPKITQYRTGTDRTIEFEAQLTKRTSFQTQVTDRTYTVKEAVGFDKLPADIKKTVEAQLVKLREMYKDRKPPVWNQGGGNKPPPPR